MSDKKESKSKNKSVTPLIAALCLCVGLIGGSIGGYLAGSHGNKVNTDSSSTSSSTSNSNSSDSTSGESDAKYIAVEDKDAMTNKIDEINGVFDEVLKKDVYFNMQIGQDSYEGYLYNTKGEILSQASDNSLTTVFTNKGHSVSVNSSGPSMTVDSSIDLISMCRNTLKACKDAKTGFVLYKIEQDKDSVASELDSSTLEQLGNVQEYVIDINGEEACKEIYSSVKKEYGEEIVKSLKEYLGDSWTPHMEIGFIWDENNQVAMYCNVISTTGSHDSNWICVGYGSTPSWELPDEWYSADYDTNTEENNAKLVDMLNRATDYMSTILYPDGNPSDSSSTTDTSDGKKDADSSTAQDNSEEASSVNN